MITIHQKQRRIHLDTKELHKTLQKILTILGYKDFDLGVLLTNNKTIQAYNKQFRGKDKPTDILSFSYHQLKPGKRIKVLTEEDKNLGDLIISLEYVHEAAHQLHIPFKERLTTLLIHGVCHLLGYDHETDTQWRSMRAKEAFIQKKLNAH